MCLRHIPTFLKQCLLLPQYRRFFLSKINIAQVLYNFRCWSMGADSFFVFGLGHSFMPFIINYIYVHTYVSMHLKYSPFYIVYV